MKIKFLTVLLVLLPTLVFAQPLETAFLPDGAEYLVDRFMVTTTVGTPQLMTGSTAAGSAITGFDPIDNLCARYGVVKVEHFYDGPVKSVGLKDLIPRMYILHVAPGTDVMAAQQGFKNTAYIETSDLYDIPEPIYEPNDPQLNVQYHLNSIRAYSAWDVIRGDSTANAIVSIVDTGVYWMHPDLAPNMWINEAEDLNGNHTLDDGDLNGLDDDGNGYVDDVIGWDSGANDNDPQEELPYHGTHVAGCASEATDNGINGAGIGFSARIMANKGANRSNQLTAVYQAMIWATENGANIVNCSWGSPYYNGGNQSIINGVWNSGVVIVAGAGNEGNSLPFYPAAYNNVVAVAATDQYDIVPYWSSYGSYVDVCAPGVGIFSTWDIDQFAGLDGTSMASPITAGTCALLKAAYPRWTNADIVNALISTADNIDDLNPGYENMLGSGRINAFAALASSYLPNIHLASQNINVTQDDGDGILNPGESFDLVVTLENIWADANNVTGTLHGNENFNVSDSVASFGNIGHGESGDNSGHPFAVTVNPDSPLGSMPLTLSVNADDYDVDIDLSVEISLNQLGFPLEISGNIESSPVIFDVDRDGSNEIIFGANDDKVYVIESDGQNKQGWPQSVSGDVITGPAIGDLAANGTYQIVAITKTGNVYAWDDNGTLLPNFPVALGGFFFSGAMLIDIDGDGDLEIAAGSFADNNLYLLNNDGSNYPGWPITSQGKWYGSPAACDIDNDMLSEIIYAGFDSSLHAYKADGSEAQGFPVNLGGFVWASPATGDIDNDGYPEIAAVTVSNMCFVVNHDGSVADGFPVDLGNSLKSAPSLADINGDGQLEIIFGSSDRYVHVIKANGAEMTGFPVETDGSITASPVVGDLTGDGHPDIVVGTNNGSLYGFEYNGAMLQNFPIAGSSPGQMAGSAALGYLDSDNDMEIVQGIKGLGQNLMVIDFKAESSIDDLLWPNFGKDIWRSCSATDVVTSAEDVNIAPHNFELSQNYPNPFNAETSIRFSLATGSEVKLSVFDLLGRKIKDLNTGYLDAGVHDVIWDGTNESGNVVASGVYFYRLESADGSQTRRMVLLK